MKTKILYSVAISLLLISSLRADSVSKQENVELLRQEIRKQEVVLQSLKEKLKALEEEKESIFEISVSDTGLQADEKSVSLEELGKELKELPDDTKIKIRVEPTVAYKEVVTVMELCAKAGLGDVVFATKEAEQDAAGQPATPPRVGD